MKRDRKHTATEGRRQNNVGNLFIKYETSKWRRLLAECLVSVDRFDVIVSEVVQCLQKFN